jgi:hypothetical protein
MAKSCMSPAEDKQLECFNGLVLTVSERAPSDSPGARSSCDLPGRDEALLRLMADVAVLLRIAD